MKVFVPTGWRAIVSILIRCLWVCARACRSIVAAIRSSRESCQSAVLFDGCQSVFLSLRSMMASGCLLPVSRGWSVVISRLNISRLRNRHMRISVANSPSGATRSMLVRLLTSPTISLSSSQTACSQRCVVRWQKPWSSLPCLCLINRLRSIWRLVPQSLATTILISITSRIIWPASSMALMT